MSEPELQPDVSEVLQEEPQYLTAVPVCVDDVKTPVRVQQLPRKGAATLTKTLSTTVQRVLTANHYRGRTLLVCGSAFLVCFSQTAAQADSSMATWPANVPLELTATAEVWAKVAASTAVLSVITEQWADGQ